MHFDDDDHEDSEDVVGGDDDDHEDRDDAVGGNGLNTVDLDDKVELHVELSAHKKVKHCVHHFFVFHLREVIIISSSYILLIFAL